MKNFCLYNGKKIVKPDIWNITSVELSSDYTSAIIQAESKSNKSEYTLDITPLIINQYKNGIDPYTATIVNELTGVSDWVLDPANNRITYKDPTPDPDNSEFLYKRYDDVIFSDLHTMACQTSSCNSKFVVEGGQIHGYRYTGDPKEPYAYSGVMGSVVSNPAYDPTKEEEKSLPLDTVAQQVISNANAGDAAAQNSIVSTFNNITDSILTSDYSEFFEVNKQPK